MAQVTITLDLTDPEIMALMKEGVKSLTPEHWTTIMAAGMQKAVTTDNLRVGVRPEHSWNDHRPTVLEVLIESVTKDIAAASASTEYLTALKERLLSERNFEDALRAAAANWVIDTVKASFDATIRNLPSTMTLVEQTFRANERLNRANIPQL